MMEINMQTETVKTNEPVEIMEEIQLSNFQKNCRTIIKSMSRSNKSILITDKGKLLVKIVPVSSPGQDSWLGCMNGTGKIIGDIVSPVEDPKVWEVLSE
jgi:antitoxin (DNA-binding transcriptional repressor) of toxin-antitoxin stability system